MTLVAVVIGGITLHYVRERLVATTGESLSLAAADVADKLDRLLFERYGDVQLMARALGARFADRRYVSTYLSRMREAYFPMYLWLGVTDPEGRVIAATDPRTLGQDEGQSRWFEALRKGEEIHVGDVEPYETAGGVDAVAFSAPIRGPGGTLRGAVTTRVAIPVLEDVVARTIRAFEAREKFPGKIEYPRVRAVFYDQSQGNRDRVGIGHGLRDRETKRRLHRCRQPAGSRCDVSDLLAASFGESRGGHASASRGYPVPRIGDDLNGGR